MNLCCNDYCCHDNNTEQVVTGLCDLGYLYSHSTEQHRDKSQVLGKSFDIKGTHTYCTYTHIRACTHALPRAPAAPLITAVLRGPPGCDEGGAAGLRRVREARLKHLRGKCDSQVTTLLKM